MKVYLIRHAMSVDAEKDISQRDDTPIARDLIKDKYVKFYRKLDLDNTYCSPITRAQQTAELLFKKFETIDYTYEYN